MMGGEETKDNLLGESKAGERIGQIHSKSGGVGGTLLIRGHLS